MSSTGRFTSARSQLPKLLVPTYAIIIILDIVSMILILKKHENGYPHKSSGLPLVIFAGIGIGVEITLIVLTYLNAMHIGVRVSNSIVRALLNLAMFFVHLVLPIVLLKTRKAYYHLRIFSSYSYKEDSYDYYDCTYSDIFTDRDPRFDDSCEDSAPARFPHGPVHTTCILFWVICAFHLILAAWTYLKEEKNRKSQRELRKEAKNIELEDRMRPQNEGPPVVVPVDDKTVMVQD